MLTFDYEQATWGRGEASISWTSPSRFRLHECILLLNKLSSGSRVLEFGCGGGQFIRAVKSAFSLMECHGSDISVSALEIARKFNDGVIYTVSNTGILPYNDNYFDAVIICDVLEHLENPATALNEIRRVLKNGGIFYFAVPCEGDYLSVLYWYEKVCVKSSLTRKYAGHIQKFSRKLLLHLLINHNFIPAKIRYSEALLGQLLVITTFVLIDKMARKRNEYQMNNEAFFEHIYKSYGGRMLFLVKNLINILVNIESCLFSMFPSPNMNIRGKVVIPDN